MAVAEGGGGGEGKKKGKKRGKKGCSRLARGGENFLKQLIGFERGLVCAFANGITLTK